MIQPFLTVSLHLPQAQEETVNYALEHEDKWGLSSEYVNTIILGFVMEQM